MRSAWAWVSFSDLLVLGLLLVTTAPAGAVVYLSQAEALELAFPDSDRVEKRTFLLDSGQAERVRKLARAPVETRIVAVWEGWRGDTRRGYAFIDVHVVRTLTQGLLVVLEPDGAVRSVRVLAFHEPEEYVPSPRWFRQFEGRALAPGLRVDRDIHGVVGATLSARAVTRSVRRSLAYHQVLLAPQEPEE
jgi:hypothetical protein